MKYLTLPFILCMLITSCQLCDEDQHAEKLNISNVISEQQSAWNKGDIEGYMQGYNKSDSLRFASGGIVTYGWETTLNRYKKAYPDKETMGRLIFSNIDIKMLSNNDAIVFGKWELERENDHPWGLFTLIFNKTDEGWKIIHDHTSSGKKEEH